MTYRGHKLQVKNKIYAQFKKQIITEDEFPSSNHHRQYISKILQCVRENER